MDPTDPPTPGGAPRTPGETIPPEARRLLERAPSDRYATEVAPPIRGSSARALGAAVVASTVGTALLVVLASPMAVSEPLVVVAVLLGLGSGLGARLGGGSRVPVRRRRAIAVVVALGGVAIAELVVWQLALGQGGVLPFLDYQWLVFGPIAPLQPLAAALAAWATA